MSATDFDGTPMTKREVLIAREKFEMGAHWMYQRKLVPHTAWPGDDVLRATAAELYPLPKVTRPRVMRDPVSDDTEWSVQRGEIMLRFTNRPNRWILAPERAVTPERVALWADLLANPVEEVEGDQ